MTQGRLDARYRDPSGPVAKKYGNTPISALRLQHGDAFAKGAHETAKLADVLLSIDDESLSKLVSS